MIHRGADVPAKHNDGREFWRSSGGFEQARRVQMSESEPAGAQVLGAVVVNWKAKTEGAARERLNCTRLGAAHSHSYHKSNNCASTKQVVSEVLTCELLCSMANTQRIDGVEVAGLLDTAHHRLHVSTEAETHVKCKANQYRIDVS